MSIQALNWAMRQDVQPSGCKLVLLVLANYADREGFSYPGEEAIDDVASIKSTKTVTKHLELLLEQFELIERGEGYDRHGHRRPGWYLRIDETPRKVFQPKKKISAIWKKFRAYRRHSQ